MSQTELGTLVDRPQSCVSVWENGGIELGADRIFQLEEHLGLERGALLLAGGYIEERDPAAWWASAPSGGAALREPSAEALGMMWDFPVRLRDWLVENGPLVEAAAMLRERAMEPLALTFLLDSRELMQLRLSWEIWAGLAADREQSCQELLEASLSKHAVARCQFALWGEVAFGEPHLRLVGE